MTYARNCPVCGIGLMLDQPHICPHRVKLEPMTKPVSREDVNALIAKARADERKVMARELTEGGFNRKGWGYVCSKLCMYLQNKGCIYEVDGEVCPIRKESGL